MFHLIFRYQAFELKNAYLKKDLKDRGVENLPNYHYMEDAIPMFEAIEDYITKCVNTIYG